MHFIGAYRAPSCSSYSSDVANLQQLDSVESVSVGEDIFEDEAADTTGVVSLQTPS